MANMMLPKLQPQSQQRSAKLNNKLYSPLLRSSCITRLLCNQCALKAIMCVNTDSALSLRASQLNMCHCFLSVIADGHVAA